MKITLERKNEAEEQIIQQKEPVAFDTREYPVEVLIKKFEDGEFIVPKYQREFVWEKDKEKMSKFIESVLLDLPIPYLFFADEGSSGKLEIVDGSQRIRTLAAFKQNKFKLKDLEVLDLLNGFTFSDLVESRQRRFDRKTLRSIELTEKASSSVRRDIFERINTKPYDLFPMEIRKGIFYDDPFYKFLDECSLDKRFLELCPISKDRLGRGEAHELVLRYFAYSEKYKFFVHSVEDFLDNYMYDKHENSFDEVSFKKQYDVMLDFVKEHFPNGFRKGSNHNSVSRVRFEAIAVGSTLALIDNPDLKPKNVNIWINSKEFNEHTTSGSANNKSKVIGRIEYVRNMLLS
jgi:uncharacterized protein with ParB-like and HNH nuclease domain